MSFAEVLHYSYTQRDKGNWKENTHDFTAEISMKAILRSSRKIGCKLNYNSLRPSPPWDNRLYIWRLSRRSIMCELYSPSSYSIVHAEGRSMTLWEWYITLIHDVDYFNTWFWHTLGINGLYSNDSTTQFPHRIWAILTNLIQCPSTAHIA